MVQQRGTETYVRRERIWLKDRIAYQLQSAG
jgi:hypothetical protein